MTTTSSSSAPLVIRPSLEGDIATIQQIYEHAVLHGTGTFETDVPDRAEMARRRTEVLSRSLPYLVAERDGQVLGFAYANYFRPRLAYRYFVEDSVYLAPTAQGQGVGRLLLAELIARCEAAGARQMVAVIGDSQNLGSIGVHRTLGFEQTGLMKSAGWKFGKWLDVVLMQRQLGQGDSSSPTGATPAATATSAPASAPAVATSTTPAA
ncbi:MAG: N-acetyltransferase [Mitsuaria chitosanitabida]|uniref:GNAT family N-acetyltransferase n=1 Tax=Roseateles chitosanitabidus TaxID=65048 RepID=UPI001B290D07|nr:GNAT family N-acetyltransferase [Roseateles chitosanitabidus]MBO9686360.1 N-acetyltransferase [Roseateles chitosanitabidus]